MTLRMTLKMCTYHKGKTVRKFLSLLSSKSKYMMLNSVINYRSAQKICHLLLALSLSAEFRTVITLNCCQKCAHDVALKFQNDEITQKEFFNYDKYKNQLQKFKNLSFHDFLLHYNFEIHKHQKRVKL